MAARLVQPHAISSKPVLVEFSFFAKFLNHGFELERVTTRIDVSIRTTAPLNTRASTRTLEQGFVSILVNHKIYTFIFNQRARNSRHNLNVATINRRITAKTKRRD